MNKEETIAVAIRICAIFLLVHVVRSFPGMMLALSGEYDYRFWLLFSVFVSLLVAVVILWKFPSLIAKRLSPISNSAETTNWNGEVLIAVGSALLGIYFLFYVISDFVYWLYIWLYSKDYTGHVVDLSVDQAASIVATFVELGFAMFLIVGSGVVSRFVRIVRYGNENSSNK